MRDACCELARNRGRAGDARSPDADDVSQDAVLHVLQLPSPEFVREPVRYLIRVARNVFVDRLRRQKRESKLFDPAGDVDRTASDPVDPERVLAGKQDLEIVLAAIDRLPPRCREAFTLHRFHGLTYAAIARRMGISTSMVEKHIAEAMLRLSRSLPSRGTP